LFDAKAMESLTRDARPELTSQIPYAVELILINYFFCKGKKEPIYNLRWGHLTRCGLVSVSKNVYSDHVRRALPHGAIGEHAECIDAQAEF
jgi:hypothetical protein